jgi:hypothetical protein
VKDELDAGGFESEHDFTEVVATRRRRAVLELQDNRNGDVRLLRQASLRPIKSSAAHAAADRRQARPVHAAKVPRKPAGVSLPQHSARKAPASFADVDQRQASARPSPAALGGSKRRNVARTGKPRFAFRGVAVKRFFDQARDSFPHHVTLVCTRPTAGVEYWRHIERRQDESQLTYWPEGRFRSWVLTSNGGGQSIPYRAAPRRASSATRARGHRQGSGDRKYSLAG